MVNQKMYDLGASPSKIRELFEYSNARKALIGSDKVFDFSLGNPSIPSPSIVNDTLVDLIQNVKPEKLHAYTSSAGDLNVRRMVAESLKKTYQATVSGEYIYMTVGAAASLTISLKAVLNKDDEVIVFSPYFPEYQVFIENALGKMVTVPCTKDTFEPDLVLLEQAINQKTKAVLINYPNNPTGVVLQEETVLKLANLLKNKERDFKQTIYLISDEPYRELVFDGKMPFISNYYNNTIICYSFSKSLSLPGERIGYIALNDNCDNRKELFLSICGAGRSLGFVCAPSLFQYMVPSCLDIEYDFGVYKRNRDMLYEALSSYGYEVVKPRGAFYLFVKALEEDANKFVERAKKYELILVPSDSFGIKGYVRIAYCVSEEQVRASLPAFKKLSEEYEE